MGDLDLDLEGVGDAERRRAANPASLLERLGDRL
jgi:hypothetical protein